MNVLYLHLAILAGFTAALVFGAAVLEISWCRNVFRAWDYLGAALLGGDGQHSISAYCGVAIHQGGALRFVGYAIDRLFGQGHCVGAARQEGLLA